ncbi:MAG: capsular biosynthesis protein [Firmicutes bacterium HGW-Firmicutes-12]|nr:MAG: capsular biosynthesis protein [Firmicutes bacterium HGW-Firmicutes-12]
MPYCPLRHLKRSGVILAGLVLFTALLASCGQDNPGLVEVQVKPQVKPQEGSTAALNTIQIKISAVGDCALGNEPSVTGHTFEYIFQAYGDNYDYFFSNVGEILSDDDLTIANLETVLTRSEKMEYKGDRGRRFWIKGDPSYAKILTAGSVEAVSLANNHSHDYLTEGYQDTRVSLDNEGIAHFGYDDIKVLDIKGLKIGLVGFCDFKHLGKYRNYSFVQKEMVKALTSLEGKADLIIANLHWGGEYQTVPNPQQVEMARLAIDHGAHLVLGHHPHILQGISEYKGRTIAYSLGNFIFGANLFPRDMDTIIYQETFTFVDGKLAGSKGEIIPCSISSDDRENDFRPRVLEGLEGERVLKKVLDRSKLIEK